MEQEHQLASEKRVVSRLQANWSDFLTKREERLRQQERHGVAAERVTEEILVDLFTSPLDWELGDIDLQVDYADLLLTRLGIKYLIVEAKRPGALAWDRHAVDAALAQACRYADEQRVHCVGVSDGVMLYAAEVTNGGLHDRVFARLDGAEAPLMLWWLSVHGIYRPRADASDAALRLLPDAADATTATPLATTELLHPKYQIPARCFAYVGHASEPATWKLPYLHADGSIDGARLPKAIQAILSNNRGTKVGGIPETAIGDVLVRLGTAAKRAGKLPSQRGVGALAYAQLVEALDQLQRLPEVTSG